MTSDFRFGRRPDTSYLKLPPFEVLEYSFPNLVSILAGSSGNEAELVRKNNHSQYLKSYLGRTGIKAKTIIVENHYIDKYFLDDFAGFYVRCFDRYTRNCTRVHFFKNSFSSDAFANLLSGRDNELKAKKLKKSYLGFVVVKRLPITIIGRTCLSAYKSTKLLARHFPITRTYKANLFGIELEVKSLAFQEQDGAVSACATSALWSAFHGTGVLFKHPIPSPLKISVEAAKNFPLDERTLPNDGLTIEQMAGAIRNVGLDPFPVNIFDASYLKLVARAFLHAKIPILLVSSIYDSSLKKKSEESIGVHAVTITGYRISGKKIPPIENEPGRINSSSRSIVELYAHDDQVGPFARMEFCKKESLEKLFPKNTVGLNNGWMSTSGINEQGKVGTRYACPETVLVPLYNKIRVPLNIIHDNIVVLCKCLTHAVDELISRNPEQDIELLRIIIKTLDWDIVLTTVNDFKLSLHGHLQLSGEYRSIVLQSGMPRFLWCASVLNGEDQVIQLLFDATDINHGKLFVGAIEYDKSFARLFRMLLTLFNDNVLLNTQKESRLVMEYMKEWFRERPLI